MKLKERELDRLSLRLSRLENENKVLVGALEESEASLGELQSRLERLEAVAHPLHARLVSVPS